MNIYTNSIKKGLIVGVSSLAFLASASAVLAYGSTPAGPDRSCNDSVPAKAWLYSARNIKTGEVELKWDKVDSASSWTVAYGNQPGKYIYGLSNFGDSNSRSVDIKSLPAGKYYFAVKANSGCMPGAFSNEWPVTVGGGRVVAAANRAVPVVSKAVTAPNAVKPGEKVNPAAPKKANVTVAPQKANVTVAPVKPATPTPVATQEDGGFFNKLLNFFKNLF